MATFRSILLHNTGLAISLALVLALLIVCALLAAMAGRQGASIKGIVFFAVFGLMVVLPQVLGHLALAVKPPPAGQVPLAAPGGGGVDGFDIPTAGAGVRDAAQVFGSFEPQGRRSDDRPLYRSHMAGVQVADAVHWPSGDSVTALVFARDDQAAAALMGYLSQFQVAPMLDRGGVELRGLRGLGGGLVHLRRSGRALLVVTALTEAALDARLAALPLLQAGAADTAAAPAARPLVPALQPLAQRFREQALLQVAGVLLAVALAAWWFVAGSAWAGRVPARADVAPLSAAGLQARLLALSQSELPLTVVTRADGLVEVSWRHTDARWLDAGGVHRLQRTHRLLLRLDAAARRVHATEQATSFDARLAPDQASMRWRSEWGLHFFQVDHGQVFGVQLGADGRPTGPLSHTWRFRLDELKAPVITLVTGAGWDWQPVVLDLPGLLAQRREAAAG